MRRLLAIVGLIGLLSSPSLSIAAGCVEFGPKAKTLVTDWNVPPSERPKFTTAILNAMNRLGSKDCEVWVAIISVIEITETTKTVLFRLGFKISEDAIIQVGTVIVQLRANDQVHLLEIELDDYKFKSPKGEHDA